MNSLPQTTQEALENGAAGFTSTPDGAVFIDGPAAVNLFRLKVIQNALAFEIKTGMKMTRHSALAAANQALGTNYRRKAQALDHLNTILA